MKKKILSSILAVAMVVSLGTSVFAAGGDAGVVLCNVYYMVDGEVSSSESEVNGTELIFPTAELEGYVFIGWSLDDDGTAEYYAEDSYNAGDYTYGGETWYAIFSDGSASMNSAVNLTADALVFNISVPMALTVDVASNGITTVADNAEIVNNALAPIVVKSVSVTGEDWAIVDYDTDFTEVKVNTKAFGMTLNDNEVGEDGTVSVDSGFGVINGTDSLALDYEVTLALQSEETEVTIATLEFVFNWYYEE